MVDPDAVRVTINGSLRTSGDLSDLSALSDLGAVHHVVLEMLAEMIHRLHAAGYTKADIHTALSDEVVLTRHVLAQWDAMPSGEPEG